MTCRERTAADAQHGGMHERQAGQAVPGRREAGWSDDRGDRELDRSRVERQWRLELGEIRKRTEAGRTGIYILFGSNADGDSVAYIGESDNVGKRLVEHDSRKDFWDEVHHHHLEGCQPHQRPRPLPRVANW